MSKRTTGFHHVAIRARDFDKSVRFYCDVLGYRAKIGWGEKPKRAIMLDAGDGDYIEIFERPEAPTPVPADQSAILHFAVRSDDTDRDYAKAIAAGCDSHMEPKSVDIANTRPGTATPVPVRIAFVKGPDGELIEFFQNELT